MKCIDCGTKCKEGKVYMCPKCEDDYADEGGMIILAKIFEKMEKEKKK